MGFIHFIAAPPRAQGNFLRRMRKNEIFAVQAAKRRAAAHRARQPFFRRFPLAGRRAASCRVVRRFGRLLSCRLLGYLRFQFLQLVPGHARLHRAAVERREVELLRYRIVIPVMR